MAAQSKPSQAVQTSANVGRIVNVRAPTAWSGFQQKRLLCHYRDSKEKQLYGTGDPDKLRRGRGRRRRQYPQPWEIGPDPRASLGRTTSHALSDERSPMQSQRPLLSLPQGSPPAASSRCHIPREGRGGERVSPGETAKMESKLKKASSNNTVCSHVFFRKHKTKLHFQMYTDTYVKARSNPATQ